MAKAEGVEPRPRPTGKKSPVAKDQRPQAERFIETARQLGADESGQQFEDAFDKIVSSKTAS